MNKIISFFYIIPVIFFVLSCENNKQPYNAAADTSAVIFPDTTLPKKVLKDSSVRFDTILIEGKREAVKLTSYNEPNYGVKTFIPGRDFIPEPSASGEGMSVNFIANFGGRKNPNAHVNIFFPAGNPGLDQLRDMTIGPQGLLAENKWRLIRSDKKAKMPYSWAQEQYVFQHKDGDQYSSGSVIIGESAGRGMQIIVEYPVEYAEGFMPRAGILLKHLKISALKEPGF
ncbi:MAG: hypothetical protein V4642_10140 [Bacteroidota bacterium]